MWSRSWFGGFPYGKEFGGCISKTSICWKVQCVYSPLICNNIDTNINDVYTLINTHTHMYIYIYVYTYSAVYHLPCCFCFWIQLDKTLGQLHHPPLPGQKPGPALEAALGLGWFQPTCGNWEPAEGFAEHVPFKISSKWFGRKWSQSGSSVSWMICS